MQDPSARRVWDTALGQLQLQVTPPNYDTWLKATVGLAADNGSFVVGTPSDFVSEWLRAKMGPVIAKTVGAILGCPVDVRYQVITAEDNGNGHLASASALASSMAPDALTTSSSPPKRLNAKFTFEQFVVSDCNRLAAAAALAAAEQRNGAYNPLFIYGAPGLGKTHLLHAIAQRASARKRHVVYATCERFTNEFVSAIAQGCQDSFRRKYRSAELLLLDDIQFLAGKDRTQEEFFHTFNDLHADGCQIVLTCDSQPQTVAGLGRRLSSRFQAGLIADIQPPDEQTRLAILRAKAHQHRITLPPDVADILADHAHDNIRELEGCLNRVIAYAKLTRASITPDIVFLALNALTRPPSSPPTANAIINTVARYFSLPPSDLSGPSRNRGITEARHIAMYLLREDAQLPLKQIGLLLGNRDHSTVIHGCRKISTHIKNPKARRQLSEIQGQLRSS